MSRVSAGPHRSCSYTRHAARAVADRDSCGREVPVVAAHHRRACEGACDGACLSCRFARCFRVVSRMVAACRRSAGPTVPIHQGASGATIVAYHRAKHREAAGLRSVAAAPAPRENRRAASGTMLRGAKNHGGGHDGRVQSYVVLCLSPWSRIGISTASPSVWHSRPAAICLLCDDENPSVASLSAFE